MSATGPGGVAPVGAAASARAVVLDDAVALRQGADVVARVVTAVAGGGRGVLSLAGVLVRADLPPGLVAGQRLPLTVVGQEAGRIVLQLRRDDSEDAGNATARLVAALALQGDGELLRAAAALAGTEGALALPGGVLAVLEDESEGEGTAGGGAGPERAAFVLHSPVLGAISVGLALHAGQVVARVSVEPGDAEREARAAAGELAGSLEQVTGRRAVVDVGARAAGEQAPPPPRPPGGFRAWA